MLFSFECDIILKVQKMHQQYTEAYRSGHNGTDSKSVVPHGTVGSNPTASAKKKKENAIGVLFLFLMMVGENPLKEYLAAP